MLLVAVKQPKFKHFHTKSNVTVVCIYFDIWSFYSVCSDGDVDAVEQQDSVCDQGPTENQVCPPPEDPQRASTQMEGKRMTITVHPASPVPLEKPRVPVRVRIKTVLQPIVKRISVPVWFLNDKWKQYQLVFDDFWLFYYFFKC